MYSKEILLAIIGLAAGVTTAGGVFALITSIGVIPRMAGKTHTARDISYYEMAVILGGTLGNVFYLWKMKLQLHGLGNIFLFIYGLASGIYVGTLATALAEMLNTTAIFTRRMKLIGGFGTIVFCMALGKLFGSFFQFLFQMAKTS